MECSRKSRGKGAWKGKESGEVEERGQKGVWERWATRSTSVEVAGE